MTKFCGLMDQILPDFKFSPVFINLCFYFSSYSQLPKYTPVGTAFL